MYVINWKKLGWEGYIMYNDSYRIFGDRLNYGEGIKIVVVRNDGVEYKLCFLGSKIIFYDFIICISVMYLLKFLNGNNKFLEVMLS